MSSPTLPSRLLVMALGNLAATSAFGHGADLEECGSQSRGHRLEPPASLKVRKLFQAWGLEALRGENACDWFMVSCSEGGSAIQGLNVVGQSVRIDLASLLEPEVVESLEHLDMHNTDVTGQGHILQQFRKLEYLDLSNTSFAADLDHIAELTNLTTLKLRGRKVTGDLRSLAKFTKLKYLELPETAVSGDLAQLAHLKDLRSLVVDSTSISGPVGILVNTSQRLEVISVASTKVGGWVEDYWHCTGSSRQRGCELSVFNLAFTDIKFRLSVALIGNPSVDAEIKAFMPKLQILNTQGCKLDMDVIDFLLPLGYQGHLKVLDARNSGLHGEMADMNRASFRRPDGTMRHGVTLNFSPIILGLSGNNITRVKGGPTWRMKHVDFSRNLHLQDMDLNWWNDKSIVLDVRETPLVLNPTLQEAGHFRPSSRELLRDDQAGWTCVGFEKDTLIVTPETFAPKELCRCLTGWIGVGIDCKKCAEGMEAATENSVKCACKPGQALVSRLNVSKCLSCFDHDGEQRCSDGREYGNECKEGYGGTLCAGCTEGYYARWSNKRPSWQACYSCNKVLERTIQGFLLVGQVAVVVLCIAVVLIIACKIAIRRMIKDRLKEMGREAILLLQFTQLLLLGNSKKVHDFSYAGIGGSDSPSLVQAYRDLSSLLFPGAPFQCFAGYQLGSSIMVTCQPFLLPALICTFMALFKLKGDLAGGVRWAMRLQMALFIPSASSAAAISNCVFSDADGEQLHSAAFMRKLPFRRCAELGLPWLAGIMAMWVHVLVIPALFSALALHCWKRVGAKQETVTSHVYDCEMSPGGAVRMRVAIMSMFKFHVDRASPARGIRSEHHQDASSGVSVSSSHAEGSYRQELLCAAGHREELVGAAAAYVAALALALNLQTLHVRRINNCIEVSSHHCQREDGADSFESASLEELSAEVVGQLVAARSLARSTQERAALEREMTSSVWLRGASGRLERYAYGRAAATDTLLKVVQVALMSLSEHMDPLSQIGFSLVSIATSVVVMATKPLYSQSQNILLQVSYGCLGLSPVVGRGLAAMPVFLLFLANQYFSGDLSLRALRVWQHLKDLTESQLSEGISVYAGPVGWRQRTSQV